MISSFSFTIAHRMIKPIVWVIIEIAWITLLASLIRFSILVSAVAIRCAGVFGACVRAALTVEKLHIFFEVMPWNFEPDIIEDKIR